MSRRKKSHQSHGTANRPRFWGKHAVSAALDNPDRKVLRAGDPRTMRVRYSPRIARWIAEREALALDADGSLTMEHPLADVQWGVRHVLQYGPDAEVLEPAELRDEVVRRLGTLLRK